MHCLSVFIVKLEETLHFLVRKFSNCVEFSGQYHCVKVSIFRVFLVRIFPHFGLNTKIQSVNLCIESKYGKIWTRKTKGTDTFYAVHTLSIPNDFKDLRHHSGLTKLQTRKFHIGYFLL